MRRIWREEGEEAKVERARRKGGRRVDIGGGGRGGRGRGVDERLEPGVFLIGEAEIYEKVYSVAALHGLEKDMPGGAPKCGHWASMTKRSPNFEANCLPSLFTRIFFPCR